MDSKERVLRTIGRESVDRPATWLGNPTSGAIRRVSRYYGRSTELEIKMKLEDDIFQFNIPYESPRSTHIGSAFGFVKNGVHGQTIKERTLTAAGFFEDYEDPSRVDDFPWPDPADHIVFSLHFPCPERLSTFLRQTPQRSGC